MSYEYTGSQEHNQHQPPVDLPYNSISAIPGSEFSEYSVPSIHQESIEPVDHEEPEKDASPVDYYDNLRESFLEWFPSKTKGLDVARTEDFIRSQGLRVAPSIIVPSEQMPQVSETLEYFDFPSQLADLNGFYSSKLDLAVVFRNKQRERNNRMAITEVTLAHELGHGTLENTALWKGSFIEEGFCGQLEGKYIAETLGAPHGLAGLGDPHLDEIFQGEDGELVEVSIASRYVMRGSSGTWRPKPSVIAATALDLLVEEKPKLWPALVKARSSAEGLEEVVQTIDSIQPGLYTLLRDSYDEPARFPSGLVKVIQALKVR